MSTARENQSQGDAAGGGTGSGEGGNLDRWLADFRGEARRRRAGFDEARERSLRLGRGTEPPPPRRETAAEQAVIEQAEQLVSAAAAVARLLAERDGRVRDLEAEIARLRARDEPPTDALQHARDELEADTTAAETVIPDLDFDPIQQARDEADALRIERDLALARAARFEHALEALHAEHDRAEAVPARNLPVLARDLARWSEPPTVVVAVAVGPPSAPPALDDLDAVDHLAAVLRRLLATPVVVGKPFHSVFDEPRLLALQARLREAHLLMERFNNQIERSRTSKEMLWHMMVARKTDDYQRRRK